jgi:lipopolysaccharide/colanic/teichoic acid biosynthesis glycosyltransferase
MFGSLSESVAVEDERRISPTLEYPRLERWPHRELWAEAAMILVVGGFTGLLLASAPNLHARKLVVLTFVATLVWLSTLHSSAGFARTRNLGPVFGAILGTAAGLVVLSLLNYWILNELIPPGRLLLMGAATLVVSGVFQAIAPAHLGKPRRVLVMGVDDAALELVRDLRESRRTQYRFVGVVDGNPNGPGVEDVEGIEGMVHLARRNGDLVDIVRRQAPDMIVCSRENVRTRTVALITFLPLSVAIAIAVRCSGPGPILLRQLRSGEGGMLFTMVKFRTMVADAEQNGAVWAAEDDSRVTTIGRFLRRTRLDEIPQFWNVLRGEMSIVGPRPERPEYLDYLQREVPFWNRRLLLKPGITGWAQVNHAYTADVRGAARKLAYDLYYLKHRSFGLDLLIVFTTFKIVLSGRGAR